MGAMQVTLGYHGNQIVIKEKVTK